MLLLNLAVTETYSGSLAIDLTRMFIIKKTFFEILTQLHKGNGNLS